MTCITEYCCFRLIGGAETEHEPLPLLGPNAVTREIKYILRIKIIEFNINHFLNNNYIYTIILGSTTGLMSSYRCNVNNFTEPTGPAVDIPDTARGVFQLYFDHNLVQFIVEIDMLVN